jgi:hypothetical protein
VNVPGLTILHSQDLVNWKYVSHVIFRLEGREQYDLKNGNAYRSGVFAPSLRYHKGTFYVVVTPVGQNTRIYYSSDAREPWQYHELDRGAFDPGLFIESDGKGYIATSGGWDGHINLLKLSEDFSKVVDAKEIHYIKGAEGRIVPLPLDRHTRAPSIWSCPEQVLPLAPLILTCRSSRRFAAESDCCVFEALGFCLQRDRSRLIRLRPDNHQA